MTNQIISPSAFAISKSASEDKSSSYSDKSIATTDNDFKKLMTSLISTANLVPSNSTSSTSSELLMPLLLFLITKLFGEGFSNDSSSRTQSSPQGAPLKGVLTQGSHTGHTALDFGVVVGTEVHSTMGGKVVQAGWNNEGYGNLVIVENGLYRTYYAHLSKIPVMVGKTVQSGEVIGLSGNTGNSTGPHLHYEVRKNDIAIDPTSTIKF